MARRRVSRHRPNRILIWLLAAVTALGVYRHHGAILGSAAGWAVLKVAARMPWL